MNKLFEENLGLNSKVVCFRLKHIRYLALKRYHGSNHGTDIRSELIVSKSIVNKRIRILK